MPITPARLIEQLRATGRPITPRTITDWVEKGALPQLERKGLGRGRGVLRVWPDDRLLDHAATFFDLLRTRARIEPAILNLWFCGFEIDPERVRSAWLARLSATETFLQGAPKSGAEPDFDDLPSEADRFFTLSARIARRLAHEYGVDLEQSSELLRSLADVAFSDAEPYLNMGDLADMVSEAPTMKKLSLALEKSNARASSERATEWLRRHISFEAVRTFLSGVAPTDIQLAQRCWLTIPKMLPIPIPQEWRGDGLSTAKQLVISVGPYALYLILHLVVRLGPLAVERFPGDPAKQARYIWRVIIRRIRQGTLW